MLFSKDTLQVFKKREEEWLTEIKKAGAQGIKSSTRSGFDLKPVFTPADLEGVNMEDLAALPGHYPYTRGNHNLGYQIASPMMTQQMSLGGGEETIAPGDRVKKRVWWAVRDLNPRLPPCEDGTLPLS